MSPSSQTSSLSPKQQQEKDHNTCYWEQNGWQSPTDYFSTLKQGVEELYKDDQAYLTNEEAARTRDSALWLYQNSETLIKHSQYIEMILDKKAFDAAKFSSSSDSATTTSTLCADVEVRLQAFGTCNPSSLIKMNSAQRQPKQETPTVLNVVNPSNNTVVSIECLYAFGTRGQVAPGSCIGTAYFPQQPPGRQVEECVKGKNFELLPGEPCTITVDRDALIAGSLWRVVRGLTAKEAENRTTSSSKEHDKNELFHHWNPNYVDDIEMDVNWRPMDDYFGSLPHDFPCDGIRNVLQQTLNLMDQDKAARFGRECTEIKARAQSLGSFETYNSVDHPYASRVSEPFTNTTPLAMHVTCIALLDQYWDVMAEEGDEVGVVKGDIMGQRPLCYGATVRLEPKEMAQVSLHPTGAHATLVIMYGYTKKQLKQRRVESDKKAYERNKKIALESSEMDIDAARKKDHTCSGCGIVTRRKLQICSRCKQESYCSRVCQSGHWKESHKLVCQPPREGAP